MHAQDKRTDTTHERSGSRRSPRSTPATGLLGLQGTAGNAAVTRAIHARRQEHAHVQHVQRPAVRNVLPSTARPLVTTLRTDIRTRFGRTDFSQADTGHDGTYTTPVQLVSRSATTPVDDAELRQKIVGTAYAGSTQLPQFRTARMRPDEFTARDSPGPDAPSHADWRRARARRVGAGSRAGSATCRAWRTTPPWCRCSARQGRRRTCTGRVRTPATARRSSPPRDTQPSTTSIPTMVPDCVSRIRRTGSNTRPSPTPEERCQGLPCPVRRRAPRPRRPPGRGCRLCSATARMTNWRSDIPGTTNTRWME